MAFVEVRIATQQAVATDGCSKGLENREEGMASRHVCMSMIHACRLMLSLIKGMMQRIFPKQDPGSLNLLSPWTAQAGAAVAV